MPRGDALRAVPGGRRALVLPEPRLRRPARPERLHRVVLPRGARDLLRGSPRAKHRASAQPHLARAVRVRGRAPQGGDSLRRSLLGTAGAPALRRQLPGGDALHRVARPPLRRGQALGPDRRAGAELDPVPRGLVPVHVGLRQGPRRAGGRVARVAPPLGPVARAPGAPEDPRPRPGLLRAAGLGPRRHAGRHHRRTRLQPRAPHLQSRRLGAPPQRAHQLLAGPPVHQHQPAVGEWPVLRRERRAPLPRPRRRGHRRGHRAQAPRAGCPRRAAPPDLGDAGRAGRGRRSGWHAVRLRQERRRHRGPLGAGPRERRAAAADPPPGSAHPRRPCARGRRAHRLRTEDRRRFRPLAPRGGRLGTAAHPRRASSTTRRGGPARTR